MHDGGTLPFVYDVADLYKHLTSIPAAFVAVRQNSKDAGDLVRKLLKQNVEDHRILQGLPKDLTELLGITDGDPAPATNRPPSAIV